MNHYAVMGNPIHHSLSPLIHSLFAKQTQQDISYQPILVPLNSLSSALNLFQSQQGKGVNITLPFKQEALQLVNHLSERAKVAQAVNTISFAADGARLGDNTDGIGLIRDLTINQKISLKNKEILILGAGGAARGILAPLLQEKPAAIVIANRTFQTAQLLAEAFSVEALAMPALNTRRFDIIINGTSASLQAADLALPIEILNKDTYCYDLTYAQGDTLFLQWAQAQGVTTYSDGLGMLVEQAAESFYIWRNVRPNAQAVLAKLREFQAKNREISKS